MAEVWDRKGSAPNVGQDRQAHYLFIPHHCRITARWVGRGVVARLGVGGGSVARKSAVWSRNPRFFSHILQHPQAIDAHPKPYIVPKLGTLPKPFDCFSLICSRRNPISCRNSVFFRNLLLVSALFVQVETLVFRGIWSGCASAWNLGSLSSSAKLASLFRGSYKIRLLTFNITSLFLFYHNFLHCTIAIFHDVHCSLPVLKLYIYAKNGEKYAESTVVGKRRKDGAKCRFLGCFAIQFC